MNHTAVKKTNNATINTGVPVFIKGHVNIKDDLGNILVDKDNAIHPQNMARVIARALADESNYYIYKMAFGHGGTQVNAAFTITYNPPHDGQPPDVKTWDSTLYNETYAEVIDEGQLTLDPFLDTNPPPGEGSNPGGGAVPAGDPPTVLHVSGPGVRSTELGLTSQVVIVCVLNANEPTGQFLTDSNVTSTTTSFEFDEIGLYTAGAPQTDTNGYQYVNVGNKVSTDNTGLLTSTAYSFTIQVDGGSVQTINLTTPAAGSGPSGQILYGDLCEAINTHDPAWGSPTIVGATVSITDVTNGTFPSILNAQTFGNLKFTSNSTGTSSAIVLGGTLFGFLNPPVGGILQTSVNGIAAGVQNNPVSPTLERERLLAHVIFSPVLKAANRTLTITYTLTIAVGRSP